LPLRAFTRNAVGPFSLSWAVMISISHSLVLRLATACA